MVASNLDHYFYLKKHDKEKNDLLLKDAGKHKLNQHNMKYKVVDYN